MSNKHSNNETEKENTTIYPEYPAYNPEENNEEAVIRPSERNWIEGSIRIMKEEQVKHEQEIQRIRIQQLGQDKIIQGLEKSHADKQTEIEKAIENFIIAIQNNYDRVTDTVKNTNNSFEQVNKAMDDISKDVRIIIDRIERLEQSTDDSDNNESEIYRDSRYKR